jgi:feruloyl-CoA synthase
VPLGNTYELRLKGDCVTPGYWRRPDLTAEAFDEDGFFLLGDAVKPVDPDDFSRGLLFDGRLSDNFKLATGTWVAAVTVRQRLLAGLAPLLTDAVITGHDRNEIGAIGFPNLVVARELSGMASGDVDEVLTHAKLRTWISERLQSMAAMANGSSQRVIRFVLSSDLPSLDNGELTDKGTASARAVLRRRKDLVAALHAPSPSGAIIAV